MPTWDPEWIFYGLTYFSVDPEYKDTDSDDVIEQVLAGAVIFSGTSSGNGILAIIEFEAYYIPDEGNVSCDLSISDPFDTFLQDSNLDDMNAAKINGYDYVGAILSLDKLDEAEKMILDSLDNFAKNGITQQEIDDARQVYLKALIDLTVSNAAMASMFGTLESLDLGFDYYDKVLKRIQTMGIEELNKICKKYFVTKGMDRVRVGRVGK